MRLTLVISNTTSTEIHHNQWRYSFNKIMLRSFNLTLNSTVEVRNKYDSALRTPNCNSGWDKKVPYSTSKSMQKHLGALTGALLFLNFDNYRHINVIHSEFHSESGHHFHFYSGSLKKSNFLINI